MADIILGFDGSRSARAALDAAVAQAQAFGDRLVVVFADEPPGRSAGEEFKEHRRALDEIAERAFSEAKEVCRNAGIEVETLLVHERPPVALETTARGRDTRLIVVGTYGEGPFRSAILGSTPHKLLHFSEVPVLCVPNPRERR
jgi:nucleotide-binding universal stress UspA family protein